jgi:hypothetical protein
MTKTKVAWIAVAGAASISVLLYVMIEKPYCVLYKADITLDFIRSLELACESYKERYGEYPPMDQGTSQDPIRGDSSRNLFHYLGRPTRRDNQKNKPIMSFTQDQIDGWTEDAVLVDAWGRRILYFRHDGRAPDPFRGPTYPGHDARYKGADGPHVDILSFGPYPEGRTPGGRRCIIANWTWKDNDE